MISLIFGYLASIAIGVVLGTMGAGGSILAVPVLVYLFHIDPELATSYSLFIVGITSLIAVIRNAQAKSIQWRVSMLFGIPSILSIVFTRRILLPAIPDTLLHAERFVLTKSTAILLLFAVLMVFSAIKMIRPNQPNTRLEKPNALLLIMYGIFVGIITGIVGVGGGFLIVPTLLFVCHLSMKQAVNSSLAIISVNAAIGFMSSRDIGKIDFILLLSITALSVVGILLGLLLAKKVDGQKLKPMFGWFILVMGIYIIAQQLISNPG